MKAFGIIYKHTNKLNGKVYIGQTKFAKNPNRRFRKGALNAYKGSTAFHKALKKYTWDGFETEFLYSAFDQESLNRAEEYFINFYNSALPNGYNSVKIVEGNIEYTEEVRAKISAKQKERYAKMTTPPEAPNKKQHILINGVPHKNCARCKENKTLDLFIKHSARWDGLGAYCKACAIEKDTRVYQGLTEEEFKKSYNSRRAAMTEGVQRYYDNNPAAKAKISQQKSKAIIATNIDTLVETEFSSALEAKKFGFHNTNVGVAIKTGKVYKKHTWRFK